VTGSPLESVSDVIAINSLVAFYDIHGRKGKQKEGAILLFCPEYYTALDGMGRDGK
jgi:hypothetical protein